MNDRYLFKAKRIDNFNWVQGNLIYDWETGQYFIHMKFNSVNESDKVNEEGCLRFVAYEVDPYTISQCTGLKDKNGKLIWENDICYKKLPHFLDKDQISELVAYNEGDWILDYSYVYKEKIGNYYDTLSFRVLVRKDVEVIGNIFDNPRLDCWRRNGEK